MKLYSVTQKKNRINDFLRGELKRRKVSQEELSFRLGLNQTGVSKRLSGQTEWTLGELILLCEVLEIKLGDIL